MTTRRAVVGGAAGCLLAGGVTRHAVARSGPGSTALPAPHTYRMSERRRVDPLAAYVVPQAGRIVALTFDDGPDRDYTPAVLDILARAGVLATFFVIGRNAGRYPDLIAAILAAGHGVGNHTQDHLWLDELPASGVSAQIVAADNLLGGQGVPQAPLFRPPRGWTSALVAATARSHGKRAYYWTDCLEAHASIGPGGAADAVATRARPRAIILCHDGGAVEGPNPQRVDRSLTVAALPGPIAGLQRRRFRFVPL